MILLFLMLGTQLLVNAQGSSNFNTQAKMKAMFIYNFTKYIEWPSSYKEGTFIVGVLGESPMYDNLVEMANTKKAGVQSFEIKKYNSSSEIDKCHMLFVPKDDSGKLNEALKKVKDYSTLVITEQENLCSEGTGINFVIRNNRQKFELNKNKVEAKELKIASSLLSLAIMCPQ